jgi:SAM-dependent methyltransferase
MGELLLLVTLIALGLMWLGVVFIGPPYVPTLSRDLDVLFTHLKLSAKDHVVDLGSGDGRVLLRVVRAGAKATGVEINPILNSIAKWRLRGSGATIVTRDMWGVPLPPDTSYVFVFCASQFISKADRYFERQVRQGRSFRVISYGFTLTKHEPETVVGSFNIYQF